MQERTVPSISVVMPAYNAEKYLREAIESILNQTYTDFELIIINDGSTDKTKEIIQSYDDSRIVYIENENNSGICVTLNKGLDIARGKYIVRMDADDIAMPTRLASQFAFMETNTDISVAGCFVERIFDDSSKNDFPPSEKDPVQCRADMLFATCVAHPAVIIRKSILDENGLRYDDDYRGMEDYHLWWRCSKHSNVTNIPEVLLQYRIHKSQVTQIPLTEEFIEKKRQFVALRLSDIGINATTEDIESILHYEIATNGFDDRSLESLIQCIRKILKHIRPEKKYYYAQKLTASKAISYAYDLSCDNMKRSKLYFMCRAYWLSSMTHMWFLKQVYHIIKNSLK